MVQATVDRIEGDIAVLVLDTRPPHTLSFPSSLLPAGCREGDMVSLTLETDPDATRRGRERVTGTIGRLTRK